MCWVVYLQTLRQSESRVKHVFRYLQLKNGIFKDRINNFSIESKADKAAQLILDALKQILLILRIDLFLSLRI